MTCFLMYIISRNRHVLVYIIYAWQIYSYHMRNNRTCINKESQSIYDIVIQLRFSYLIYFAILTSFIVNIHEKNIV